MPILVSSVWIGYFRGAATPQTDHLDRLLGSETIVVADLIVAEVLQGFREVRDFERAREALLRLPVLKMGGTELALARAESYRLLRRQGVTIRSTIDCLDRPPSAWEGSSCSTTTATSTPSRGTCRYGWSWNAAVKQDPR